MPKEPMTLIERLRNPQWRAGWGASPSTLDTEFTIETMREAADKLERLDRPKPKFGDWLQIDVVRDGMDYPRLLVQVSNGDDGVPEWRTLTEAQKRWLVGLANISK